MPLRRLVPVLLTAAGLVASFASLARAQNASPDASTPNVAAAAAAAPQTLADALQGVTGDANGRASVLLCVDPGSVRAVPVPLGDDEDPFDANGNRKSRPPLYPLPPLVPGGGGGGPQGYAVLALAQTFGRIAQRFGRVTVLAPAEMVVLNPRPGPPDLLADLRRSDMAPLLLATLSSSQWQKIGSSEGLGRGDRRSGARSAKRF